MQEHQFDFDGGDLAIDFANTVGGTRETPTEHLHAYADLAAWAKQARTIAPAEARELLREAQRRPRESEAVLRRARELREAIFRVFAARAEGARPAAADLALLNAALASAMARARVAPSADGYAWSWDAGARDLDRVLWPVARAAADLLVSERAELVKTCASDTCDWLFIDRSRNRSRRWCDMSDCGNRAKVRRYFERKRRRAS